MALIRSAIPLAEAAADPVRVGELWERLARYLWSSGDGPAGVDAGRTAVALVAFNAPSATRARVLATLGRILMNVARFAEARPVLEAAVAVAASAGAHAIEGNALTSLAAVLGYLGDFESARLKLGASREIAIRLGSVEEVGRADGNLIDLLVHVGERIDEAARRASEAFTFLQESYAASSYGVMVLCEGAGALIRLGRWGEADALLGRARGYVSSGVPEIVLNERLALLEVDRGQHDDAAERIALLRRLIGGSTDPQWNWPLLEVSAELALWQRRPKDAQDEIGQALGRLAAALDAGNISRVGPVIALAVRAEADQTELVGRRMDAQSGEIRGVTSGYLALMREIDAENRRRRSSLVRLAGAWLRLCEAEGGRVLGEPSPQAWSEAALAFASLEMPISRHTRGGGRARPISPRGGPEATPSVRSSKRIGLRPSLAPSRFVLRSRGSLAARGLTWIVNCKQLTASRSPMPPSG